MARNNLRVILRGAIETLDGSALRRAEKRMARRSDAAAQSLTKPFQRLEKSVGRTERAMRKHLQDAERRISALERQLVAVRHEQRRDRDKAELLAEVVEARTGRPLEGHILVYGLQGSGNVITQHILRAIAAPVVGLPLLRSEASERHKRTTDAFRSLAQCLGPGHVTDLGYGRPWELNGAVAEDDDVVIFPAVHSAVLLAEGVYGTHALPNRRDVEAFTRAGGKVFIVLRHPLDVMTSFATKSVPVGASDRRAERDGRLADTGFLSAFAWQIDAFWRRFEQVTGSVTVIRYEDILLSPEACVHRIGRLLGRPVPPEMAAVLAAQVGTADLAVEGHRFEARAGSWEGSLPRRMLPYFEGVREMASGYGYDWPAAENSETPALAATFHVVAYSFDEPRVQAFLEQREMLQKNAGLVFICERQSPLRERLERVLEQNPQLAHALSNRSIPIAWGA